MKPSDEKLRYLKKFVARARHRGPHGLANIERALHGVAGNGTLSMDAFCKAAMALGLCYCFHECRLVFGFFDPEQRGAVSVEGLMRPLRGAVPAHRFRAVAEAWERLDPEGYGELEVGYLVGRFDARRLPLVRSGVITATAARREMLEALGAGGHRSFSSMPPPETSRHADFVQDEFVAKRRPPPTGAPGVPLNAPGGRPSGYGKGIRRELADTLKETATHPPEEDHGVKVTMLDFEAYYAAVSSTISDDDLFTATVRNGWGMDRSAWSMDQEASPRCQASGPPSPSASQRPGGQPTSAWTLPREQASIRVSVIFEDGSQHIVLLRDAEGLDAVSGAGGCSTGQIFALGPEVYAEVKRRLEAQGVQGIRKISWRGYFS